LNNEDYRLEEVEEENEINKENEDIIEQKKENKNETKIKINFIEEEDILPIKKELIVEEEEEILFEDNTKENNELKSIETIYRRASREFREYCSKNNIKPYVDENSDLEILNRLRKIIN
jgi:hypothetical protein